MAATIQDTIMLFGDSITQFGWGQNGIAARLADVYSRKLDVVNRGFAGFTTEAAIPIFEQIFATREEQRYAPKVSLLTIAFGANDASPLPSVQHVPLSKFKANLKYLISMVRSPESQYYSPFTRIVLISPPPINTYQWGNENRQFEITKTYAEAVIEVAREVGVGSVDAWTAIWDAAGHDEQALSKCSYDGLHLNAAGYEIVYNELIKTIQELYPELHYENIEETIAPWSEIDHSNLRESVKLRTRKTPKN